MIHVLCRTVSPMENKICSIPKCTPWLPQGCGRRSISQICLIELINTQNKFSINNLLVETLGSFGELQYLFCLKLCQVKVEMFCCICRRVYRLNKWRCTSQERECCEADTLKDNLLLIPQTEYRTEIEVCKCMEIWNVWKCQRKTFALEIEGGVWRRVWRRSLDLTIV